MCDPAQAAKVISELLQALGIARVVCVDDQYDTAVPVEQVIGLCKALSPEQRGSVPGLEFTQFDADPEVWIVQLRTWWETLSEEGKLAVHRSLRARLYGDPEGDLGYLDTLADLLRGCDFRQIPPDEWRKQKDILLVDARSQPTLFLFDQDLSRAGGSSEGGIEMIQEVLASDHRDVVMCGLLSHTFRADDEYRNWESLAASRPEDRDRFLSISKRRLHEDPLSFAHMLKLAVLNRQCRELKEAASRIAKQAYEDAQQEVDKIRIYDFDHIVFGSSSMEGVWEPDTLFRLFGLFHRSAAMRKARTDEVLHELAARVRSVRTVRTRPSDVPLAELTCWKIQRLELYDDPLDINALHLPLELGDIFHKTTSNKKFILLAQPCDLMVRSDGKRRPAVTEATLAEITPSRPDPREDAIGRLEAYYELPYFDPDDGTPCFVDFRKVVAVRLCVLDLCVYQEDGSAKLNLRDPCPRGVIPAWNRRYGVLQRCYAKAIRRYGSFSRDDIPGDLRRLLIPCSSIENVFKGTIDPHREVITYGIRRVGRLRQPRAGALLTRFSAYVARAAFEHDFGRVYESETSCTADDSGQSQADVLQPGSQ